MRPNKGSPVIVHRVQGIDNAISTMNPTYLGVKAETKLGFKPIRSFSPRPQDRVSIKVSSDKCKQERMILHITKRTSLMNALYIFIYPRVCM